jgi:hypothetical protein
VSANIPIPNAFGCEVEDEDEADECGNRKELADVISEWSVSLRNIGYSQASYDELFKLIHKYKPTFTKEDLKKFPKSGKGLCYLPEGCYKNITFRNLLDYDEETNDFPENDYDDNSSTTSSVSVNSRRSDDEDACDADESDNELDEIAVLPAVDCYDRGIEPQIALIEENKIAVQELAYFGIENVLTGKCPGILDCREYVNVLKAIATLDENALSDDMVNELFKKELDEVSYLSYLIVS